MRACQNFDCICCRKDRHLFILKIYFEISSFELFNVYLHFALSVFRNYHVYFSKPFLKVVVNFINICWTNWFHTLEIEVIRIKDLWITTTIRIFFIFLTEIFINRALKLFFSSKAKKGARKKQLFLLFIKHPFWHSKRALSCCPLSL